MTKMHVSYLGDLRTEAEHLDSKTRILSDAPKDNQGRGEAFSPTDLLATSLGSCMLTIMGIKARSLGVDMEGTSCEIEKIMQAAPRKVSEIKVQMHWGKSVPAEHFESLKVAALNCPVMLSLASDVKKTLSWE